MSLTVWLDDEDDPYSFELCYEKGSNEFALRWSPSRGYDHSVVDSGEQNPARNSSPLLRPGNHFDCATVRELFVSASGGMPKPVASFVSGALRHYPNSPPIKVRPEQSPYRRAFSRLGPMLNWQSLFWVTVFAAAIAAILAGSRQ